MPLNPLLVGECNPYGADPKFALYPFPVNSAGGRLCRKVLGLRPGVYLEHYDRRNLCPTAWDLGIARRVAAELVHEYTGNRWLILCGARVANAFGLDAATRENPIRVHERFDAGFVVLPHPSGRNCRIWSGAAYQIVQARLGSLGLLPGRPAS